MMIPVPSGGIVRLVPMPADVKAQPKIRARRLALATHWRRLRAKNRALAVSARTKLICDMQAAVRRLNGLE